jgi:hypothetical protein
MSPCDVIIARLADVLTAVLVSHVGRGKIIEQQSQVMKFVVFHVCIIPCRGGMSSLYPANICRGLGEVGLVIIEEIGLVSLGKLGKNLTLVLGNIETTISNREDVLGEDVMIR